MSVTMTSRKSTSENYSLGRLATPREKRLAPEEYDMLFVTGEVDFPEHNGKYDSESVDKLVRQMQERVTTGTFHVALEVEPTKTINISKVYGEVADCFRKEDGVYANIVLLDTMAGEIAKDILMSTRKRNLKLVADTVPPTPDTDGVDMVLNVRLATGK